MPGGSLRQQLLVWLLPASVVILVASILIAYLIAARAAGEAWDQGLHDAAEAFADRLRNHPAQIPAELPAGAERMLIADPEDRVWFRLKARDGRTLAGNARLPALPPRYGDQPVRYGNSSFEGRDIRLVALHFEVGQGELELTIGSTMRKRDALVRDILLGMVIPELILFFAMIVLMEIAIERGLAPLGKLRDEISARSHLDLRPVTLNDVPDELQAVASEINELLDRLSHSIVSQSNFVADAAHQLRTPVAALQAQAEILRRETTEVGPQERLGYLVTAVARLSHLVRQLLALARAEPSPNNVEQIDLPALIKESAETHFPRAIAAGIDLGFDLQPVGVRGSPILIQEMIANLVDNALRYTPPPGSVTVRCRRIGGDAVLQIEDSGPGIPESERQRVFERFHRLPGNTAEGSGLGLAIVREITHTHGGSVSVSAGNTLSGALFEVRLPAA